VLTGNGKLLVVGWDKEVIAGFGTSERLDKESVQTLATKGGFMGAQEIDAGEYHYAFIFTK
jgi:hypothetical protein